MTVLVGRATDSGVCRVVTAAEHVDEPRSVEFQLPKSETDLQRGHPLWANYVKGVVAFFPHKGFSNDLILHQCFLLLLLPIIVRGAYEVSQKTFQHNTWI